MLKENVKKHYDKLPLEKIESVLSDLNTAATGARKQFIFGLIYLRTNGRYREDKRFSKSSFDDYLKDRWMIHPTTLQNEYKVFGRHPKAADKYGPGVVNKIGRNCGDKKVAPIIKLIDKMTEKAPTKDHRKKIDKIISKNLLPSILTKHNQPSRVELIKSVDAAHTEVVDRNAQVKELTEQVKKLKASVLYYKEKYENLQTAIGSLANDLSPGKTQPAQMSPGG